MSVLIGSATAQVVVNPVNGHSYEYVRIRSYISWGAAKVWAAGQGGYLATITDATESGLVAGLMTAPGQKAFLGASDINDSCAWLWMSGEPWGYTNWATGEPAGEEPCENSLRTSYELGGKWEADVGPLDGYIIEWDFFHSDTLSDFHRWPVSEGGNGHWYALLPIGMPWDQARDLAGQFDQNGTPGHLATITSEAENLFIADNIVSQIPAPDDEIFPVWLGGYDDSAWVWITGEPFSYTNWGLYEPDSASNAALAMIASSQWGSDYNAWLAEARGSHWKAVIEFDTEPVEPQGPDTLYVPEEYATIQSAIDSSKSGDLVLVSPGIYHESLNYHGKNITVRSTDGPSQTVITNERTVDLVTFENGETHDAVLDGFTLSGGWIAIVISSSAPTITHNVCVSQNVWNWSAIAVAGSIYRGTDPTGDPRYFPEIGFAPAVIINNTIVNSANGGIYTWSSVPPTLWNNIVAFNANYGIAQQTPGDPGAPLVGYNDVFGQEEDHGTPYGNYINIPDPGPGSISLDPVFSNDFAATWNLGPGSPCINAGDPDTLYNDPDGSRNDMGAVPYDGGGGVVIPTNEWIVVYCEFTRPDVYPVGISGLIQAFDPSGVLCGQAVLHWTGTYGLMPIYRDDPYTEVDEGCEPGDLVQFKVDGQPVQPVQAVHWTANGDVFEVCEFYENWCLDIPLRTGWNLISWNFAYEGPIRLAFGEIIGCIDVVLSFDQGGLVFDPNLDAFNTLTEVDHHHAYWVRMNCDAVLQVCGSVIPDDDYISLRSGWNLVPYWPATSLPIETGFYSILDNLQIALGFDNGAQIWLPNLIMFNTLTYLNPTFGYWVRVSEDMPLIYPNYIIDSIIEPWSGGLEEAVAGETTREWMSVYGSDLTIDGTAIRDGAAIDFSTAAGVLCGHGIYSNGTLKLTPVYGQDDSGNLSKAYPTEGDALQLLVEGQRVYPDLLWAGNGSRVQLSRLTTDSRGLPQTFILGQNYPNPFNPATRIPFDIASDGQANLSVFNVLGQKVRTLADRYYPAGRYEIEWNGCDDADRPLSTGIYFYKLTTGETTLTKKMLLLK